MAEYRVTELARAAGSSVRNIRVYQERGLLSAPLRRGRAAIYTDAHLTRLRLVVNMLGRGYTFAQIAEMLAAWESGSSLADVLGLEESLAASWAQEEPKRISAAELAGMFGTQLTPANIRRALDLQLLERDGTSFVAPSPRLLEAGAKLVELGVPLREAISLAGALQHEVDHVAGLLVGLVRQYVLDPRGPGWLPSGPELPYYADLLRELKPLVGSALNAAVARSVNRVLPEVLGDRLVELLETRGAD